MKMTPELLYASEMMRPGQLSRNGFFGDDERDLATIIADQKSQCRSLRVSWEKIADKLDELAKKGIKGLGAPVVVDDKWEVDAQEHRGKTACPFPHPGMYQKTVFTVKNIRANLKIRFSNLSIHMIKAHCFFGGRGAYFYNDPATVVQVLEMEKDCSTPPVPISS